jgi:hypothetical protein
MKIFLLIFGLLVVLISCRDIKFQFCETCVESGCGNNSLLEYTVPLEGRTCLNSTAVFNIAEGWAFESVDLLVLDFGNEDVAGFYGCNTSNCQTQDPSYPLIQCEQKCSVVTVNIPSISPNRLHYFCTGFKTPTPPPGPSPDSGFPIWAIIVIAIGGVIIIAAIVALTIALIIRSKRRHYRPL